MEKKYQKALAMESLNGYSRLPERMTSIHQDLSEIEKPDLFGAEDRLRAVQAKLPAIQVGRTIDLGAIRGILPYRYTTSALFLASLCTTPTP